ncbi:MAG: UvrD-helicase domain-containing protein, partial [Deltaproteobacteria bacterium]|nr:UvrD-helicase domain-containing protein [Deltaproteobacteria bacterium]
VHSLVPLPELLAELFNCGAATKKVAGVYGKLINEFGSEFNLLLHTPIPDIKTASPMLAEAIDRVRQKRVIRKPGFDGEFGIIKVFSDEERTGFGGQLSLFGVTPAKPRKKKGKKTEVFIKQTTRKTFSQSKKLNPEQQTAVDSPATRIIVKAGPGTGKTHTLVQRVIRLLAQQQSPITVITFTNKAADEIRQRLAKMDSSNKPVRVDTFHGYCLHWLRRHDPDLQVAGPEMRSRLFESVYPQIKNVQRKKLQREAALFLSAQSQLPKTFPKSLHPFYESLRQHKLLDLDEVIPACTALIHHDSSFAGVVRATTGHLLVDEFQDLNAGQYELVRLLAKSCSIFAIGDPDQAIYGFRGSTPAWFYRFIEEQKPELHSLVTNYRSGSIILKAASRVIAANHVLETPRATVAAGNNRGVIYHHLAADAGAEASFIADQVQLLIGGTSHREIDRLHSSGGSALALSDIAILYRTGRQAAVIAEGLAKRSIPCQVVDIQPFYQTGDAKIIYFWILLAACMIDKAELLFLLGREQGIGRQALSVIEQFLADNSSTPFVDLAGKQGLLPAQIRNKIDKFIQLGAQYIQTADNKSIAACIDLLIDRYSMDKDNPDLIRIGQLAASAVSLHSFADHLRKYQDAVIYDERAEAVLLATLHASKGLEFKAVFLVGCEEGLLPLAPRTHLTQEAEQEHVQEERRLFFVGMTRAARVLYLSGVSERRGFESSRKRIPSRFLAEIPVKLLSSPPVRSMKRRKQTSAKQLRLF